MAAWVEGRVAGTRQWTQSLVSLMVTAPDVKPAPNATMTTVTTR